MSLRLRRFGSAFVLAAVLGAPATARAMTLVDAMERVAGGIVPQIVDHGARRVQVRLPRGPVGDAALARMRLELVKALEGELARREVPGVELDAETRRPDLVIDLEYSRADRDSRYAMSIRLLDGSNNSLGSFNGNFETARDLEFVSPDAGRPADESRVEVAINAPTDRAALEGKSFDATLGTTGSTQPATNGNIVQALSAAPAVFVQPSPAAGVPTPSIVSAREGSPFRLEILVKPGPGPSPLVPRAISTEDGYAYCELGEGEVYAVRVYNDAPHAVAVDLGIDGINMWETSTNEAWRRLGKFAVPAGESVTIRGWHFGENGDPNDYREFQIVKLPDGLAAQFGSDQGGVGQISAQFFAAWRPGEPQPAVEPKTLLGGSNDIATGMGDKTRHATANEPWFIGRSLLAAVTVRYDREFVDDLPAE